MAYRDLLAWLKDEYNPQAVSDVVLRGSVGSALGMPSDMATGVINAGKMAYGYGGNKLGLLSADEMPEPIEKGITYLDEGSRGAGQGTHNFVVFDPSTVDIISRNGVPYRDLLKP